MANPYREYAEKWVHDEYEYQVGKSDPESDDVRTFHTFTHWGGKIEDYLHRAYILGLDNPNGRQAAAKAAATGVGMLESVVRSYGALPEPGVPSGENIDKIRVLSE